MNWGYIMGAGGKTPVPFNLDEKTHCHALLSGGSGSGKSYSLVYLCGQLLQNQPDIKVYFCDFKNSEDFAFLNKYPYYYSGDDSYRGVMEYYESFCNARKQGNCVRRYLLVFDEYPACISYYATKDKIDKTKKSNEILSAVAEILMLGRGISFGIWIVTQRADASLFLGGSRDDFQIIVGLGRMSKEQKSMIFFGEEIPNKVYHQGEGCILADGYPLQEIVYPRIRNTVDWKKHILRILQRYCDK